ncbi:MAG: hypothetical protein K0R21_2060 [Anaerocolumna sp.]|jgi:hypothetical protein|nr:hypothetical protein [Anaerocolumna sp.]
MSIGVCGRIKVISDNVNELVESAYSIQKCAVEKRIGLKMGGNVSRNAYDMYSKTESKNTILFEVTDSPLDNYSDTLFFPTIDENSNNYEQEFSYKINRSIQKLNDLLQIIMDNEIVECIYLDFNYLFKDNEKIVDIKIDSLSKFILSKYIEEGYFTPVLSMRITK